MQQRKKSTKKPTTAAAGNALSVWTVKQCLNLIAHTSSNMLTDYKPHPRDEREDPVQFDATGFIGSDAFHWLSRLTESELERPAHIDGKNIRLGGPGEGGPVYLAFFGNFEVLTKLRKLGFRVWWCGEQYYLGDTETGDPVAYADAEGRIARVERRCEILPCPNQKAAMAW